MKRRVRVTRDEVCKKFLTIFRKLPGELIPLVIAYVLRQYGRYGLAEIVEKAWDWLPERGE
jgi:hypothetical protein